MATHYRMESDGHLTKLHPAVVEAENLLYGLYGWGMVSPYDNPVRALGMEDIRNHRKNQRLELRRGAEKVKVLNVVW